MQASLGEHLNASMNEFCRSKEKALACCVSGDNLLHEALKFEKTKTEQVLKHFSICFP